jgi:hypothetical protein
MAAAVVELATLASPPLASPPLLAITVTAAAADPFAAAEVDEPPISENSGSAVSY